MKMSLNINQLQPSRAVNFQLAALTSQKGVGSGFNRHKTELWRIHRHVTSCFYLRHSLCTEGLGSAHPCHWRGYVGSGQTNYDQLYQPYNQILVYASAGGLRLPSLNKPRLGLEDRCSCEKVRGCAQQLRNAGAATLVWYFSRYSDDSPEKKTFYKKCSVTNQ